MEWIFVIHYSHVTLSLFNILQELKEIEDHILYRLSSSEGSPVDDIDLIQTLEASKLKSQEITVGCANILIIFSIVSLMIHTL